MELRLETCNSFRETTFGEVGARVGYPVGAAVWPSEVGIAEGRIPPLVGSEEGAEVGSPEGLKYVGWAVGTPVGYFAEREGSEDGAEVGTPEGR